MRARALPRRETALLAAIHMRALHAQVAREEPRAAAGPGLARHGLRSPGAELGGPDDDGPASLRRVDPHDGAVCVFRDTPVVAHFSRPLDAASVDPQTFRVWDDRGVVEGRLRLSPDASVLIWEPAAPLAAYVHHFVSCSGLRDLRSRAVTAHLSRFLTCDLMRRDLSG